nr:uncharacterized protein K02A2.6-like [Rhipicephalus microplus]
MKAFKLGIAQTEGVNVVKSTEDQREMENLLHDFDHVVVYFDDILVTGTSDKEHWENLVRVLDRLKTAGLRLKLSKCEFMKPEVQYLGHIISAAGLRPNPAKTEAELEAPHPERSRNFRVTSEKPTVLVTDASPFGIGAVLAQRESSGEERPIGFASRSLATAEKNYSQLDKEALSLLFGVTKFRQYLWGRQFEAVTDHKPLLGLLAADKPVPESCSPRVLRWALLLSGYTYDLKYRPGSQIAHADGLSRLPLPTAEFVVDCPAEVFMLEGVYPGVLSSNAVAAATSRDPVLSQVRAALWSGCQINLGSEGRPYDTRFHEMSVQGNCLLWGNRVIVPKSLQKEVLQLLHESHPGLSKMKAVARSHVWWPSLDNDIAITIQRCRICQEHQRVSRPVPVMPWPFPEKPWSRLYVDYAGPYRNTYFFIAVNAFSKWIEVFPVSTPSAEATISCMHSMFANQGLPDVVVSDNGPAFTSELYSTFLKKNGVRRMLVPPYHSASNGAAERAVQTVKNKLRKAGPRDIRTQIARMPLTYKSTPLEVTGCCPSELLLGRKLRTALDLLHPDLGTKVLQEQLKQKIRCDQGTRPTVLGHPGDQVFARNFRPGPAWLPAVVTEQRTSSMNVLLEDGRRLTRHLDHIRQAPEELSADNQKSGSPVSTGLAPSLDVGQTQLTGLAPGLDVGQRQLSPDRLHDTESRQDPREDVAREPELAVRAPSTPVLRRSTRIRRPVSRYAP